MDMDIYIDASVNQNKQIGYGVIKIKFNQQKIIQSHLYENTKSSTICEIKTLFHALQYIKLNNLFNNNINIYTDCQNAINLMNFRINFSKKIINSQHYELYIMTYELYDFIKPTLIKIKGHQKLNDDKYFEFKEIDKIARKLVRMYQ
jgi:ribonuclease HI